MPIQALISSESNPTYVGDGPRALITRAEARNMGLVRYFTGIPCKWGHIAERIVVTASCCRCHNGWRSARFKERSATDLDFVEKLRKKATRGYWANRSKRLEYTKLPHVMKAKNARRRERHSEDAAFALNGRISSGIRRSIKRAKAGRRWETLVGYTLTQLLAHIERQFTKRMSWDNMGNWHIDHVTPLALFNFTSPDDPDFKSAWALTNLRPLWALKNLKKGAKREFLL